MGEFILLHDIRWMDLGCLRPAPSEDLIEAPVTCDGRSDRGKACLRQPCMVRDWEFLHCLYPLQPAEHADNLQGPRLSVGCADLVRFIRLLGSPWLLARGWNT